MSWVILCDWFMCILTTKALTKKIDEEFSLKIGIISRLARYVGRAVVRSKNTVINETKWKNKSLERQKPISYDVSPSPPSARFFYGVAIAIYDSYSNFHTFSISIDIF